MEPIEILAILILICALAAIALLVVLLLRKPAAADPTAAAEATARAMADTIKNREQEKMDALAAMGAFIGDPVVDFKASENSTAEMVEGNFVWGFKGTPTPPFKSGTLKVAYTTAGFDSYFEEVE